jgi:hypothetical protein
VKASCGTTPAHVPVPRFWSVAVWCAVEGGRSGDADAKRRPAISWKGSSGACRSAPGGRRGEGKMRHDDPAPSGR